MNINNDNLILINALIDYLKTMPDQIDSKTLENVKASGVSELYAYASLLNSYMGLDESYIDRYLLNMIRKEDISKYTNDPFYQAMNLDKQKIGNLEIDYSYIEAYELYALDEIDKYLDGRIYPQVGYSEDFLKCLTIIDGSKTLYSFNPLCINANIIPLEQIKGKVAIFGAGNGYFAFMANAKEDVESIIIYESNEDLIKLFTKCMLPKFKYPEKVKVIKADPYLFLKNKTSKLTANYAYINCWEDIKSAVKDYPKYKKLESIRPKIKYLYYLEESIYNYPSEASDENS